VLLLTVCDNELETVWSLYHDVMSGISYYTVEVGAHFGPFGNTVGNFVGNLVGLMLRGLLGGLKFVVGEMLNSLKCDMSVFSCWLQCVGIRKAYLCMT
jgi:hypothetical protein